MPEDAGYKQYKGQPCVTLANNYYKDTVTRAPALCRYGYFHSLNNYVYNFSMGYTVYALIFTEDAPSLEAALHRAFEKQKVNKVNPRREFFHVSLEQIKRVVRENYDKTVEWIDIPPAEQFRQSLLIGKTDAPAQIDRTVPQLTTPMDSVSVSTPKKTSQVPSTHVPVAPSPVFTPKETLQAPITPGPAAAPCRLPPRLYKALHLRPLRMRSKSLPSRGFRGVVFRMKIHRICRKYIFTIPITESSAL